MKQLLVISLVTALLLGLLLPVQALDTPAMPDKEDLLSAVCVKVVDGDTAWFEEKSGLVVHKVRLIGVDTPETRHPKKGVQPFGPEASAYTESRLLGQAVYLEYDVEENDRYDRHLCYVWLADGSLFNLELLCEGYAVLLTWPPNVKYVDWFTKAQAQAREAKKGLWGLPVEDKPE